MITSLHVPSWLLQRPIAHRGLFDNVATPENSLAAFAMAVHAGCPIELDIRRLADGNLTVFHDANMRRLTGSTQILSHATVAHCRQARLLNTHEFIPLLADVLDCVAGKVPLLLEIKDTSPFASRLVDAVVAALSAYQGEYAFQSFNPFALNCLRRRAPHVCRGQLSGGRAGIPFQHWTRPNFIAYQVDALPNPAVSRLRSSGIPLLAWTVRTPSQLHKALELADNYIFEGLRPVPDLRAPTPP